MAPNKVVVSTNEKGLKYESKDKAALAKLHNKHFSQFKDVTEMDSPAGRAALTKFQLEAASKGIAYEFSFNFHKESTYEGVKSCHEDCSGGQQVGVVFHSNTSEDGSGALFSAMGRVEEKVLVDGAFGHSMNIRTKEDIQNLTDDFIGSAYISGHQKVMHPVEMVIGSYGTSDQLAGRTPEKIAELGQIRNQKLINEWKEAGFMAENGKDPRRTVYNPTSGRLETTFMVNVLHTLVPATLNGTTLEPCRYYVISPDMKPTEFAIWAEGVGINYNPRVEKLIELFEGHKGESEYYGDFVATTGGRKSVLCVDSRHFRMFGGQIKVLGSLLSEEQMIRILSNPFVYTTSHGFHEGCGAITVASEVHAVGAMVKKTAMIGKHRGGMSENIESMLKYFEEGVTNLLDKKTVRFDFDAFMAVQRHIRGQDEYPIDKIFPKSGYQTFQKLFDKSLGDMRMTAQYLHKLGALKWDGKERTLVVPIASSLDASLGESSNLNPLNRHSEKEKENEQKKEYVYKLTLKIAAAYKEMWESVGEANQAQILEAREKISGGRSAKMNDEPISVRVTVESFKDRENYFTDGDKTFPSI